MYVVTHQMLLFLLIVMALLVALYQTYRVPQEIEMFSDSKKVRFNPVVQIAHAGGSKQDRYNPELRRWVQQNSNLARAAGGVKRLIQMDDEKW